MFLPFCRFLEFRFPALKSFAVSFDLSKYFVIKEKNAICRMELVEYSGWTDKNHE